MRSRSEGSVSVLYARSPDICIFFRFFLLTHLFLAHLTRRLIGELIVYLCSGVRCRRRRCRPPFLNVFSSETAWPINAKFFVEPPWEGGTKVCINGPGHLAKMVLGKEERKLI